MRRKEKGGGQMKRTLVWLLILALMAALTPALAEEALTAEDQAYAMANISNDFLSGQISYVWF